MSPENVITSADFIEFLTDLQDDYRKNQSEWENQDIEQFLEGFIGFFQDAIIKSSTPPSNPNDKNQLAATSIEFADLASCLLAARVYE